MLYKKPLSEITSHPPVVSELDQKNLRTIFANAGLNPTHIRTVLCPHKNFTGNTTSNSAPVKVALLVAEAIRFYNHSVPKQRISLLAALYHDFGNSEGHYSSTVEMATTMTGFVSHAEKDRSVSCEEIIQVCDLIAGIHTQPDPTNFLTCHIIADSIILNQVITQHEKTGALPAPVPLHTIWAQTVLGRLF